MNGLGDALPFLAPLGPRRQLRAFLVDAEFATGLVGVEPGCEGRQRNIHKAEGLSPKVLLVSELTLQKLQDLDHVLPGLLVGLPLQLPQPRPTFINLLVDEVRPEACFGPLVGVGGEEGVVGPDLVNVLDDDEGFADRFAVVDEHGDLLVDR
uniref:Uncharacterized protein LOC105059433 n=1 Tax=Elaeis guineensis var. tenera TaxID=51953 RepID=A0A6I9SK34_ELAGV